MRSRLTLLLLVFTLPFPLSARVDLLLVPPADPIAAQPGAEFRLYLSNPTEFAETLHLPPEMTATYASDAGHGRVQLAVVQPNETARVVAPLTRQTVMLRLLESIPGSNGFVSLRLISPDTNAIMFEVLPAPAAPAVSPTSDPNVAKNPSGQRTSRNLDLTSDLEGMRRHISIYDPIYFAVGWRERFNARFQFSFRYRVFESGPPGEWWVQQLLRDFYLAYTQTSIWDLETFSKPFYDSSYKPTAFLQRVVPLDLERNWRLTLQTGVQHESNGKGGGSAAPLPPSGLLSTTTAQRHPSDSRSMNTLYFAPKVRWSREDDLFFEARARVSVYFKTKENPDIPRYRGYLDLTLRGGYDRGFQASVQARGKADGHGSVDLNLSWPTIKTPLLGQIIPPTFGAYALIQYFNGYGESLLDYDVRRKDQLRFGLMFAR